MSDRTKTNLGWKAIGDISAVKTSVALRPSDFEDESVTHVDFREHDEDDDGEDLIDDEWGDIATYTGQSPIDMNQIEGETKEVKNYSPDEIFKNLMESGVEAVLERDYPLALEIFRKANEIRPNDPMVKANLDRLSNLKP